MFLPSPLLKFWNPPGCLCLVRSVSGVQKGTETVAVEVWLWKLISPRSWTLTLFHYGCCCALHITIENVSPLWWNHSQDGIAWVCTRLEFLLAVAVVAVPTFGVYSALLVGNFKRYRGFSTLWWHRPCDGIALVAKLRRVVPESSSSLKSHAYLSKIQSLCDDIALVVASPRLVPVLGSRLPLWEGVSEVWYSTCSAQSIFTDCCRNHK